MSLLKLSKFAGVVGAAVLSFGTVANAQVDPSLPDYERTSGVSGAIKSVGSDTMNNVMTYWCEDFVTLYPNVEAEVEGKGSSTAPPALISGASNFGPMSRQMKSGEVKEFEDKFGYKPTFLATAIDMLAVFVHKDNPIAKKGLTLQQLDAMFSSTRKGGYPEDITTWGQVGLTGEWATMKISLYGRNSASGTYGYFKKHALFKGSYKSSVKEQGGSAAVVQAVANEKGAIGYSGIGYKTADVATVPLKGPKNDDFVQADAEFVEDYALARFLYVYVNKQPNKPLDTMVGEFVKYMFSKQGQADVAKSGYLPISNAVAESQLEKVGLK